MSGQLGMGLGDSVSSEFMLKAEYLQGAHVYATAWVRERGDVCMPS